MSVAKADEDYVRSLDRWFASLPLANLAELVFAAPTVALFPLELTQRPRLKDTQADKEYLQRLKNFACNSLRFGETDFVTLQNQKTGVFLRSDERVRWLLQDAEGSFGSF